MEWYRSMLIDLMLAIMRDVFHEVDVGQEVYRTRPDPLIIATNVVNSIITCEASYSDELGGCHSTFAPSSRSYAPLRTPTLP